MFQILQPVTVCDQFKGHTGTGVLCGYADLMMEKLIPVLLTQSTASDSERDLRRTSQHSCPPVRHALAADEN